MKERYVPGKTIVLGASFAWGARIAQEKLGLPLVTLHLQPAMFPSLDETPVYNSAAWLARLPRPLKRAHFYLIDKMTDGIAAPEINRLRISLGLGPVRHILRKWTHSPIGTICLFPDWFAKPQFDWPPRTELAGFPLYDGDHVQGLPPEIEFFLKSGPSPVIFTAGSAMRQARPLFEVYAKACRRLHCRGLFINPFPDQIPVALPPEVLAVRYVPFGRVFPLARVIVHHGGIGTTAQALSAGVPQLVTPFAHDQFDNVARVVNLGVGEQIAAAGCRLASVTAALDRLMKDAGCRERAHTLSSRLNGPVAISQACDLIFELLKARP